MAFPITERGVRFDRSKLSHVTIPYKPELRPTTGVFTFEFWMKQETLPSGIFEHIVNKNGDYYIFYNTQSGRSEFKYAIGTGQQTVVTVGKDLLENKWNHFALVYDGTNLIFYMNGEPFKTNEYVLNVETNNENNLVLGKNSNTDGGPFSGILQDFRVWNIARSHEEIKNNLYSVNPNSTGLVGYFKLNTEPTGTTIAYDSSSLANHATLENGAEFLEYEVPIGITGEIILQTNQTITTSDVIGFDLVQEITSTREISIGLNQMITSVENQSLQFVQVIGRSRGISLDLIQAFGDAQLTTLRLRAEIYRESQGDVLHLHQQQFIDSFIPLQLNQDIRLGVIGASSLSIVLSIYSMDESILSLELQSYTQENKNIDLILDVIKTGEIDLPFAIQLINYRDMVEIVGKIKLSGEIDHDIYLSGDLKIYELIEGGIDMTKTGQDFAMISGDTKILIVAIDEPTNLAGVSLRWGLRKNKNTKESLFVKSLTDGISIEDETISVKLEPIDTESLTGDYYHEMELTDGLGNVSTIFTGKARIETSGV